MSVLKKIYSIRFNQLDSTNAWTKTHAYSLAPDHITCVTAEEQTAGRGRFARPWFSPKGNIYASLFFSIPKGVSYLPNLTQVLSFSCAKVLEKKGFSPQIKWPNDLLLFGKKVAGVLTETIDLKERQGIVVGIGINVNMTGAVLQTIDQPATSLAEVSQEQWNLNDILQPLLEEFNEALFLLEKEGFAPFQPGYQQRLALQGETIQYQKGDVTQEGICHSVSDEGHLNVLLPSGEIETLHSGEIQILRKLISGTTTSSG